MGFLNLTYAIDGIGDETGNKPVACFVDKDGQYIPATAEFGELLIDKGFQKVATDYIADLDAATNRDVLLTVGATIGIHMGITYAVGADATVRIFRDTTHTAGAVIVERNRNQNETDECLRMDVNISAGGGADGTQIFVAFIPGGTKANSSPGGGKASVFGWVLEANTKYLVRVRNISAAATPISIQLDWHSHGGGCE